MDNLLIKRCLAYGVKILPYQLERVLKRYEINKIPDDVLKALKEQELRNYVQGLYRCTMEDSRDWLKGHELLKSLGFEEVEEECGHRVFTSLVYKKINKEG